MGSDGRNDRVAIVTDVARAAGAERMVAAATGELGRLDWAFDNAGIGGGGGAVVWLCSDEAGFMAGAAIPVDGGWRAQ